MSSAATSRQRALAICCLLLIPALLGADVTLRYKVEYKLNSSLPPAMSQAMDTARLAPGQSDTTILLKGGMSRAALAGFTSIADLPNDRLTLLDTANRHFATVAASQYADEVARAMPPMPPAVRAVMSSMKITTDSRATGRTDEIQGIQADEREFVVSVGFASSPVMKMAMQLWLAKSDEVTRNPALQEFVASGFQAMSGMNPTESLEKMFGQFPGMGDSVSSLMKEIAETHSVTLRMHTEVFMPALAMLSQLMPADNNPLSAVDPNAALLTMDQELAEISTAPISPSEFQIPDGYTAVPLADILAARMPKAAVRSAPAAANSSPVRNGVTQPSVLHRVDPGYTEEARANKINGGVLLSVVVGTDGKPTDIKVLRSLDPGLDQKAIEAVQQWEFRPGMKDGVPVVVRAQIEVNFRLLARPAAQN